MSAILMKEEAVVSEVGEKRLLSFKPLPSHLELPESDGSFVKNFQEHPQSILLTDSILPVLEVLHPDGQFAIGQDSGIYWRLIEPPERGAISPDWYYVPNVPPTLDGIPRRSYVLWQEFVAPLIVLEFVSGSGREERDKTPYSGKFWVYEQVVRVPFYGIYEVHKAQVEMYYLVKGAYELLPANEAGRFLIEPMGVEIGIWQGRYQGMDLPWLRWWDAEGNLLLIGSERAEMAQEKIVDERQRAVAAEERAERLLAQLQALGVEPNGE